MNLTLNVMAMKFSYPLPRTRERERERGDREGNMGLWVGERQVKTFPYRR